MPTHKWSEIKAEMAPERRARLDAEVRREVLTIGPWFPKGAGISHRDVAYAFLDLPYHIRCEILTILGAPMEDTTFVAGFRYLREHNKLNELAECVREAAAKLSKERAQYEDVFTATDSGLSITRLNR
jgi:hypothetical protein